MRLLQQFDRPHVIAGIARHDAEEHVDAIVDRAAVLATRQEPFDRFDRPAGMTEEPLRLLDVEARLRMGAALHQ